MGAHIAYWVVVALAASPTPLLFLVWLKCIFQPERATAFRSIPIITATVSYVWLLLAMEYPALLGEYYSHVRFAIMDVNFVVMFGCAFAAFRSKSSRAALLGFACLLIMLVWGIVAGINAVV